VLEVDGTKLGTVFSVARFFEQGLGGERSPDEFLVWRSIPFNAIGREIHEC
jgi:hypothetical protein